MFCLIHDLLLLIRSEGPVPNKLPVASCVESWMCLYSWHLAEGATPFVMYKEYVWNVWGSLYMQDGAQEIATSIFVIGDDWWLKHQPQPLTRALLGEHGACRLHQLIMRLNHQWSGHCCWNLCSGLLRLTSLPSTSCLCCSYPQNLHPRYFAALLPMNSI